jgi:hypothetical protein
MTSWKLIRDGYKDQIPGRFRVSPAPEAALRRKLLEELGEYLEHLDPAELYDMYDVLDRLIYIVDPDGTHERRHEDEKVRTWGRFSQLLEWRPDQGEEHDQRDEHDEHGPGDFHERRDH